MSTPSAMSEHSRYTEINVDHELYAVTFTANGSYLISGSNGGVGVWRMRDGERVANMQVKDSARCVAVSTDGRWIAAESDEGEVLVWDATTYEQGFADKTGIASAVNVVCAVDFSPDSKQLIASYGGGTATVFDVVAAGQRVRSFHHATTWSLVAKYSPRGERIATASSESIRIWDSKDGSPLADIAIAVNPWYGLFWFDDHLFVMANDNKIKRIDASTRSTVSDWSVPPSDYAACIALPQHGEYVAYSTGNAIRFWNTSTHTQNHLVTRYNDICSVAFSPDDQFLAIGMDKGRVVVTKLSFVKEPKICIESAMLDPWKDGQLVNAEALITTAIPASQNTVHHLLASRALVRARLGQWDAAVVDAEESINAQPSVTGYIAKCVTLVGKGEKDKGLRVCDIAFQHFHSDYVTILLLIKAVVLFMAGEYEDAISRVDDLITTIFFNSTLHVVQAYMYLILGSSQMESGDYERAIQSFEHARVRLGDRTDQPPLLVSLISGWKFDELATTTQQLFCEALFVAGRTKEAGEFVSRLLDQEVNLTESMKTWVSDFTQRCLQPPENQNVSGDVAKAQVPKKTSHTSQPTPLSREWARSRLMTGSWKDALAAAAGFTFSRSTIYQVLCEHLERTDQLSEAAACFLQMRRELPDEVEQANWTLDFQSRCCQKLEDLADSAINTRDHDKAISQYTLALSLYPAARRDLLVKRSKASAAKGMWEDALNDANEVIKLDPSSPLGYERKNTALYGMGHGGTVDAFEAMLLKMSESSDPKIREQSRHYIRPEKMREAIRKAIENTICDSPSVLIDTTSGRLCSKAEQAAAFELTLSFMELVSTMTTEINHTRIEQEVGEYFRYATFSHKWEDNEPLFEKVMQVVVYDLEASPTHHKLQMFCKIVREAGFNWAWCDTCCINKANHVVLQEALVNMFKWYEGSAMTVIFLRGVGRLAERGALTRSIWNTRLWTLEEYHASKVVRFYTEDWTPYLGLDIHNHKESPEIVSEMEEATGISARDLLELRPGLDDIREKLQLASTRQTTRVEDAAYALLGIFSASIPIAYGEGDKTLGRLLAQLLTSSGDVSILAWTGRSGGFNSCLPASITVFKELPTSHIPPPLPNTEMTTITAKFRSLDLTLVTRLYDQLSELPLPAFSGRRMKLPCLTFKLGQVSVSRNRSERIFRAQTFALGIVEIKTGEDLSQLGSLYLVHPWVDFLLDRQYIGSAGDDDESSVSGEVTPISGPSNITSTRKTRRERLASRIGQLFGRRHAPSDVASLLPPSTLSPVEKRTRVLQCIARLRQPFGALLLTQTRRNTDEYRRVSTESLITVQVGEITPVILEKLLHSVRMLDVL